MADTTLYLTEPKTVQAANVPVKAVDNGDGTYSLAIAERPAASASLSNVAASASNVTLKAANTSRRGLIIFNDADKVLNVKLGATASATSFTVQIAAGGYWEMPQPVYQGVVDGIWASGPTGAARITELS